MTEVFNNVAELRSRGYALREPPFNIVAYDPAGDGKDRDSFVLLSREEWRRGELWDPDLSVEFIFRVILAHRMPIDLELPDKIAQLLALSRQLTRWRAQGKSSGHAYTVETNGVGYGIQGALAEKLSVPVIGYTTVGKLTQEPVTEKRIAMPRLAALDLVRLYMEMHRLKTVRGGPGIDLLIQELNSFVWRRAGRPEAMAGEHDDLVLALAGGLWIGTKVIPPLTKQQKFPAGAGRVTPGASRSTRLMN